MCLHVGSNMDRTLRTCYLLLFLFATTLAAVATPPTVPGQLVLKLRPGATHAALAGALQTLGATDWHQKFPHALPLDLEKPGAVDLQAVYQVAVPLALELGHARTVLLATVALE